MKQAKILVTKEVIRVERTKGLTGSIYKGMFWHSTQFLLSSSGQADTKFMIWQRLTHANFSYDMAEPIQFPVDIVQHDDQVEQPMQQHDVQQPPPPQQQREPPVAAPDDLEVYGMVLFCVLV